MPPAVHIFYNIFSLKSRSKTLSLKQRIKKINKTLQSIEMEQTFIILKPSTISRSLVGDVLTRFQRKGLRIAGIKMMQLNETILREHYAHLVERPFFPTLVKSMMATPVIVMVLEGKD